jgi:hypothetical protein
VWAFVLIGCLVALPVMGCIVIGILTLLGSQVERTFEEIERGLDENVILLVAPGLLARVRRLCGLAPEAEQAVAALAGQGRLAEVDLARELDDRGVGGVGVAAEDRALDDRERADAALAHVEDRHEGRATRPHVGEAAPAPALALQLA